LQILRGGDPGHVFDNVIEMLERSMKKKVQPPSPTESPTLSSPMQETIAMIAFAPYKARSARHDRDGTKNKRLTAYSLAATIASLYQLCFGRVVVVGLNHNDVGHVQDAVEILISIFGGDNTLLYGNSSDILKKNTIFKLGIIGMDIAQIHVTDPTWISNGQVERNVPRAAIVGIRLCLAMSHESKIEYCRNNSMVNTAQECPATLEVRLPDGTRYHHTSCRPSTCSYS